MIIFHTLLGNPLACYIHTLNHSNLLSKITLIKSFHLFSLSIHPAVAAKLRESHQQCTTDMTLTVVRYDIYISNMYFLLFLYIIKEEGSASDFDPKAERPADVGLNDHK